jgi:Uma2 family endonuclease
MATVALARFTPEDLLEIRDRPMPELVGGRLIERTKGQRRDAIACLATFLIVNHASKTGAGLVNGSRCGFQVFEDEPEKVRVSDASFTRRERLPDGPAEGHARVAPDLIIEVPSSDDTADRLESKINDFLAAGVALLWVVYPESKTVQVHRRDGTIQRLQMGDFLDGENILPGFRCELAALFA